MHNRKELELGSRLLSICFEPFPQSLCPVMAATLEDDDDDDGNDSMKGLVKVESVTKGIC